MNPVLEVADGWAWSSLQLPFALKETALETTNCHMQEEPLSCTTGQVT